MRNLIIALFAVFILQSCTKELGTVAIKDTKWELSDWPGKTLPTSAKSTLNITGGNKVGGKSFCNSYGGSVVINGNAVKFSNLFSTKMYCAETGNLEQLYFADLEKARAGKVVGNKLYFYNDGVLLMKFTKIP